MIHVSRSLVARWEYGDVYPSVNYLDLLAKVLDVTTDELIDNEEKMNVIKEQESKLKRIDKKIKIILYSGVTMFALLVPLLYFCRIYSFVGYDYSSGLKVEKIFYYAPIDGIDAKYIWIVFVSFALNISLIITLNIFTFRKKDFTSKLLKILILILTISIFVAVLVFIMGTINPPQLK